MGRGDGEVYRRDIVTSPQHAPALPPTQHVAMPHITPGLTGHHVLTVSAFNREQLHQLFNLAHHFRASVQRDRPLDYILKVTPIFSGNFFLHWVLLVAKVLRKH